MIRIGLHHRVTSSLRSPAKRGTTSAEEARSQRRLLVLQFFSWCLSSEVSARMNPLGTKEDAVVGMDLSPWGIASGYSPKQSQLEDVNGMNADCFALLAMTTLSNIGRYVIARG